MKKFNIGLIALSLIFTLNSCTEDDIMQDSPSGTVVENYYKTPSEFTRAILGTYQGLKQAGFYSGSGSSIDINILGDLLADDIIFNTNGRGANRLASTEWFYDANSTPTSKYASAYNVIMRANLILNKIDNLENGSFKNQVRGEALAIRALVHLELARTYAKIPTQSADALTSQGIVYSDAYDPFLLPSREPNLQSVYDKILADFTEALNNVTQNNGTSRISKNTIQALIARTYLYLGNYNKVIEFATPVVNAIAPAKASELNDLWRNANSNGVLFEIPFVLANDPAIGVSYSQGVGVNINMEYSVDKRYYDLFDQTTEPERIAVNFSLVNPSNAGGRETIAVNKYIAGNVATNILGVNNGRYLRVEETILDLAEAQYLAGDQTNALATLDKLRNVRYSSFTGGETGDALFEAIILERRKELAFETGDRWFTLKRLQNVNNIPSQFKQGVVRSGNGFYADGTGSVPVGQKLEPSSHKWQLPIDTGTLNRNPNLKQTSGY